jgi:hypothetical protein
MPNFMKIRPVGAELFHADRQTDMTTLVFTLISGFRRDADDICALVGYYAASCVNCLPTFRGQRIGPTFKDQEVTLEDGTDTLFRNVGKELPHDAA